MDLLGTANKTLRHVLLARGVESRTRTVRGHPVHHYRLEGTGSGPPLVLLHGLGGSANSFYKTFFGFRPHFRSIWAPDLPGNGFSPLPAEGALTLEAHVEVLLEFLDQVVGEPVFLVGNSLGGAMTLAAGWARPAACRALGLVSPAGAQLDPARMAALVEAFDVQSVRQARALTRRLFHRPPLAFLAFSGELRRMYGSPAVRRVLGKERPQDFLPPQMLGALAMPTALVWGKSEKLLPYEGLDYFRAHLPPHAEVHEVAGFGHLPQLERPSELVALLVAFARRARLV